MYVALPYTFARGCFCSSRYTSISCLQSPKRGHIASLSRRRGQIASLCDETERDSREMGDERVKNEAMEIMGLFQVLPRLVVFDLDYTLWPFYCECRSKREMPSLYPQAKGIIYALKEKGVDMAIASRSPTADIANTFVDKLGIKSMFVAKEIFSSWTHKTDHFQRINRRTSVPYNEMLFFDDEDRNIQSVSKMGVASVLVSNGVNLGAFREGLSKFSQNLASREKNKRRWQKFSQKQDSPEGSKE